MNSLNGRTRLAIGPVNQCGQPYFWAGAAREHVGIDAVSFAPAGRLARRVPGANLQGPADHSIPHRRLSAKAWRRWRIERFLAGFSHVMVESLLPVLSGAAEDDLGDDLPALGGLGLQTSVVLHGSEIRDPAAHQARHAASYFSEASPEWIARMSALVGRNRALIDELGLPVFVSTPDLLLDVPHARWLPLSIDVDSWAGGRQILADDELPVVLHLPSRRDPPIKGTQYIEPVLQDFDRRGLIRYLGPAAVPHTEMRALVQSADVVVDQILTGSYGVAAVEAMAAGRVVMGYVGEETLAELPDAPPIVQAPPADFASALEAILDDRAAGRDRGAQGVAYARRQHDGRAAAEVLGSYLTSGDAR